MFPTLRWGVIEASAQWVPWVRNEVARRYEVDGKRLPDDVFSAWNIFVACQTDDDIPWILRYAGEHSLIIGTDYGHTDPSSEVDAMTIFKDQRHQSGGERPDSVPQSQGAIRPIRRRRGQSSA